MDAKIDMLHRSGVIGKTPGKAGLSLHKSGEGGARVRGSEEVRRMVPLHKYLPHKRLSCVAVRRK